MSSAADGRLVASIRSTGATRGMSITCERGAPMLLFAAPVIGGRRTATLELTGTAGSRTISVPVTWNPAGGGGWYALLADRAAVDLLAGGSNEVGVNLQGRALGTLSLIGSRAAIRSALAACYAPPPVSPATTGSSGSGPGTARGNSLPVRFGTYAEGGRKCGTDPTRQVFIDEGRGGAGGPDAIAAIESIRKTGATTYAVREDVGIQDFSVVTATYTTTGPEAFSVRTPGNPLRSYRYCPLAELPLDQQEWPRAEHKRVASLPVKPGYYRMGTPGATARQWQCAATCGYARFAVNGAAFVFYSDYDNSPPVRIVIRTPLVTQTGAQTYAMEPPGGDEEQRQLFVVTSPTEFHQPDALEGDNHYRAIPQPEIPARYLPRL